jgi:hypothetical protein
MCSCAVPLILYGFPMYCSYYQAHVDRPKTLFLVAALRSFEHVAFDRTLNAQEGIFEFYVPQDMEPYFLKLIAHFEQVGIVKNLIKKENRLITEALY